MRDRKDQKNCNLTLTGDGSQIANYRILSGGGTMKQSLAQLVRYIMDQPRLPLSTWEYWARPSCKLCYPETIEILREGGYEDPNKVNCIFCGEPCVDGIDWFSNGLFTGPGCWGACCRRDVYSTPNYNHYLSQLEASGAKIR